jgi:hypothetical protein
VAIDQSGKINTLLDPLADLTGVIDPDELADQSCKPGSASP